MVNVMGILKKIKLALGVVWSGLDGWKSIISYLLLQIPELSAHPWAIEAIEKAVAEPTAQNIGNAVLQILLIIALTHKGIKEVRSGNYPLLPRP